LSEIDQFSTVAEYTSSLFDAAISNEPGTGSFRLIEFVDSGIWVQGEAENLGGGGVDLGQL